MNNTSHTLRSLIIALVVMTAALYRVIPHPGNFSPVGAMALFGGACFANRYIAFLFPLITLWLGDLILNNFVYGDGSQGFTFFYSGFYWVYGSFMLVALIGSRLKGNIQLWTVPVASFSGSVLFFIITNFGVWATGTMYTHDVAGLVTCYAAGLPFFNTTLAGDLLFSAVLFGSFELLQRQFPALQVSKA